MDRLSAERRSWNMSRIRSKDTGPEIKLRKYLYSCGLRYRIRSKLPGKPDIVINKKTAIFVNGCFWHCHEGCNNFRVPKTRSDFWAAKLGGNVQRDKSNYSKLEAEGIKVLIVWECELEGKDSEDTMNKIYRQATT